MVTVPSGLKAYTSPEAHAGSDDIQLVIPAESHSRSPSPVNLACASSIGPAFAALATATMLNCRQNRVSIRRPPTCRLIPIELLMLTNPHFHRGSNLRNRGPYLPPEQTDRSFGGTALYESESPVRGAAHSAKKVHGNTGSPALSHRPDPVRYAAMAASMLRCRLVRIVVPSWT